MKKLVLLMSALIAAIVLVGCFDSDGTKDSITIDWVDQLTWDSAKAGSNQVFRFTLSASQVVTQDNIEVSFETATNPTSANAYFTANVSDFSAQYTYKTTDPKSYVTVDVNDNCPAGTYTMKITGNLGSSSSTQKVTIIVSGTPATITSVDPASVAAGSSTTTTAKIANGSSVAVGDFAVTFPSSINTVGTVPTGSVTAYSNGEATITIDASNATAGSYEGILTLGESTKQFTVTVTGLTATITSVANVSVLAGSVTTTTAIIANGSNVTVGDFSVTFPSSINSGTAPLATVSAYANGVATISINAENATVGTFTGTLALGSDSKNFTVTVSSTPVVEKTVKLYNPYAKDGFNSAFNIVDETPIAGEVVTATGKMVYDASDSVLADIAVDNSADIRNTEVVAELTSINNGMFVNITKAEYEAATTAAAVKALATGKTFTDNEAILTVNDDIAVDGYFILKLANGRGYAAVQMAELNTTDSEGSTGNTGYLKINYKFTAM